MDAVMPFAFGIGLALCTLGAAICGVFPLLLAERPIRIMVALLLGIVLVISGVALMRLPADGAALVEIDRMLPSRTPYRTSTPWVRA